MAVAHQELSAQCTAVRAELKAWEKEFAAANGGRKAGRADIKANAAIAAKYKEYNRIRDILDGKVKPQPQPQPASPKRKAKPPAADVSQTPTKKVRTTASIPAATPTRRNHEQSDSRDALLSASKIFSPAHVQAMIGPTPQKDGIVLGLFDLLPTETPSKQRTVLGDIPANYLQTPKKNDSSEQEDDDLAWSGKMARMGRTPVSEGKRHFLDQFATPMKRKRDTEEGTPSSRGQATPMFLRRDFRPMSTVAEEPPSPRVPRRPRSFMRSLSTILQERRKEQEEDAKKEAEAKRQAEARAEEELNGQGPDDDEEAAMWEMEHEAAGVSIISKKSSAVLVEDSQFDMKLGADGENVSDSEDGNDELDHNGQPRRVWKKRGAKRQTRRVTMRPVRAKPKSQQPQADAFDSDEDEQDDAATIAETQELTSAAVEPASEDFHDSDDTAVEDDSDHGNASEHTPKKRKVQSKGKTQATENAQTSTKKAAAAGQEKGEKKENVVRKAARKISAQAHANFRKLKIKNKNSKANGRGGWSRNRR